MARRKGPVLPQQFLDAKESAELSAAIQRGDTDTVVHYNNLVVQRRAAYSRELAAQRAAVHKKSANGWYAWVGIGSIVATIAVCALIFPSPSPSHTPADQAQIHTSGPCNAEVKSAAVGDIGAMAANTARWTGPWAVARDASGSWIDPSGLAYEEGGGSIRICVLRTAAGYEVWGDPDKFGGTRRPNWVAAELHPESKK